MKVTLKFIKGNINRVTSKFIASGVKNIALRSLKGNIKKVTLKFIKDSMR